MRVATLLGTATVVTVLAGTVLAGTALAGGGGLAVTPTRAPAAEFDSGLGVRLTPDATNAPAGTRRAVAELVATRRARRIAVTIRATGVARALGDASTKLRTRAGKSSSLAVAWSAVRDGAGTIELQARSLDRRGKVLARSSATLWVLRAGDRVFSGTAGLLDLQVRQVRALTGLSGRERARRLERVLGAGASAKTSIRAEPGTDITVSGTIRFTDQAGKTHGSRDSLVQVLEQPLIGNPRVVWFGYTGGGLYAGDEGRYSITLDEPVAAIDAAHLNGYNLIVRAFAEGLGYSVSDPSVTGPPGYGGDDRPGVYHIDSPLLEGIRRGSAVTVDLTTNNTDTNNRAFSVADASHDISLYSARDYGYFEESDVDVEYPSTTPSVEKPCSCYVNGRLHITWEDAFDYDTIDHEWGHHVMQKYGIVKSPGGRHGDENLSEVPGSSKDKGIRLAWAEGWPTFYGTVLQQYPFLRSSQRGIPTLGDTHYTTTTNGNVDFDYDLESQSGSSSKGEDHEIAVQRVLWDVFDDEDDAGDVTSLADHDPSYAEIYGADFPIQQTLIQAGAKTFSQAYAALVANLTPRRRAEIGCIAAEHNISPDITKPANGSALTLAPPTIVWDANGGGPKYRNNKFVVQFYDAEFSEPIHQTTVTPAAANAPEVRYTPTLADWAKIRLLGRSTIYVIVRGTQTDPPVTGPYDSCALRLGLKLPGD